MPGVAYSYALYLQKYTVYSLSIRLTLLRDYLVITKRKFNKFSRVSHHKKSKPDTERRENNNHLSYHLLLEYG